MQDDRVKKNHSRITVILEGDYHNKLVSSCKRAARSKRAEIQLRVQDSLLRFPDLPINEKLTSK